MKIILTGSSGFIGTEILSQAISNPEITSIVALSRKPLPEKFASNPKVSVVIIEDFASYTPDVLKKLEGVEGCIWAIGAKSTSIEVTRKVSVEYTLAAAKAFSALPRPQGRPFRFVFVSGFVVVRDQKASVWFFPEARKVAGEAELNLIDFADKNTGFESYIARPAFVLPKEGGLKSMVTSLLPSVKVDALAAVLLDAAMYGNQSQTLENADLVRRGRELGTR
ncbi:putative nucleoside-diphosphate-sugar epimerase [Cadophora sp. DSE1049]|nr:putative nucleoside-diphosphate-sugar epimerase [Cadophora sp. DSE1049]